MERSMRGEFGSNPEKNPLEEASRRWGVDLKDEKAVLAKLRELQTNTAEVADLSNLWQDYQDSKDEEAELDKAA